MAEEKKPEEEKEAKVETRGGLLAKACAAYGIAEKYLLASKVQNGEVVLITHGGAKVRWREGDKVERLHHIRVTGINPDAKKRKPITGTGKKKEKE